MWGRNTAEDSAVAQGVSRRFLNTESRVYPFKRRIKSRLQLAGIIKSSPYSSR
jgi:hypothetical protein